MNFFSNLLDQNGVGSSADLEWDETQFASPQEDQMVVEEAVVEVEVSPVLKGNKKRTRNFSVQEDNLLVAAWLEISMDAVQGIDQPRATYWERIHDYYHLHKEFDSDRNCNSLTHRWGIILEMVNKFCGWYGQVQRRAQSGTTEQDKVLQACDVFKKEEEKSFTLLHCWNILKHEQKWHEACANKKQKTSSNSSPRTSTPAANASGVAAQEEGASQSTDATNARPDGRKKEKERQRKGKNPMSPGENLYMDAMENLWVKKKEVEELKELKKKERNDERIAIEMKRLQIKMDAEKERCDLQREELELRKRIEEKKMEAEKERTDLQRKELELKKRIEDDKIMKMDLTSMSDRQRLYYEKMQDLIIAQRFGGGGSN